jgi:hypothetical protein
LTAFLQLKEYSQEENEEEISQDADGEYNLIEYWTIIKRFLVLFGKCVAVEIGGDIVVARVEKVVRNMSEKIIQVEIVLNDSLSTKITLYTELGKKEIERSLAKLKEDKNKDDIIWKNKYQLDFIAKETKIRSLESKLLEGNRKFVYWKNDYDEVSDMKFIQGIISDIDNIHDNMVYDRKNSRKQIFVTAIKKPSETAWAKTKQDLEDDYVCLVYPEEAFPGNKFEVKKENPQSQQKDLWEDHNKAFAFLERMLGIPHNTNKKKERQNNPEMEMIESQFLTHQQEKRENVEKGIEEWLEIFGGRECSLIPIELIETNPLTEEIIEEEEKKEEK